MIENKTDYRNYVSADRDALQSFTKCPLWKSNNAMVWLTDPIAKWERLLRRVEYWENCHKGAMWKFLRVFLRWRFQRASMALGFSIPINVCGPGLCILHYGSVVVSRHSRIGANCVLNSGVNIGARSGELEAPVLGDCCYVGPGAKLWGGVVIANEVTIGANACVSIDVPIPGSVVVGVNRVL